MLLSLPKKIKKNKIQTFSDICSVKFVICLIVETFSSEAATLQVVELFFIGEFFDVLFVVFGVFWRCLIFKFTFFS